MSATSLRAVLVPPVSTAARHTAGFRTDVLWASAPESAVTAARSRALSVASSPASDTRAAAVALAARCAWARRRSSGLRVHAGSAYAGSGPTRELPRPIRASSAASPAPRRARVPGRTASAAAIRSADPPGSSAGGPVRPSAISASNPDAAASAGGCGSVIAGSSVPPQHGPSRASGASRRSPGRGRTDTGVRLQDGPSLRARRPRRVPPPRGRYPGYPDRRPAAPATPRVPVPGPFPRSRDVREMCVRADPSGPADRSLRTTAARLAAQRAGPLPGRRPEGLPGRRHARRRQDGLRAARRRRAAGRPDDRRDHRRHAHRAPQAPVGASAAARSASRSTRTSATRPAPPRRTTAASPSPTPASPRTRCCTAPAPRTGAPW